MNSQYSVVKMPDWYIKDSIRIMYVKNIRMEFENIPVQLKYIQYITACLFPVDKEQLYITV